MKLHLSVGEDIMFPSNTFMLAICRLKELHAQQHSLKLRAEGLNTETTTLRQQEEEVLARQAELLRQ